MSDIVVQYIVYQDSTTLISLALFLLKGILPYTVSCRWLQNCFSYRKETVMIRIHAFFGVVMSILFLACNNDGTKSENSTSDTSQSIQSLAPDTSTSDKGSSVADSKRSMDEVMKSMMQNVHSMKMTDDPDHDFAMMMKHHHDAAIEMSNIEMSGGKSAELKQLAQKIIDDSKKDNAELETFLSQHQPK